MLLVSEQAGIVRVPRVDIDLHVFFPAGVPTGFLQVLRKHAVRTLEGLLPAVAEFGLAILQLNGVVNVIRHIAEGLPIRGHTVAQPQEIAAVNS